MLMPSGGIAKYYRRPSGTLMEINDLPRGRDAAILHRITKCARPVTLVRESAPFMRLCDAPARGARPAAIAGWRALTALGFVPKLLRFDESRGTLSLVAAKLCGVARSSRDVNYRPPPQRECAGLFGMQFAHPRTGLAIR